MTGHAFNVRSQEKKEKARHRQWTPAVTRPLSCLAANHPQQQRAGSFRQSLHCSCKEHPPAGLNSHLQHAVQKSLVLRTDARSIHIGLLHELLHQGYLGRSSLCYISLGQIACEGGQAHIPAAASTGCSGGQHRLQRWPAQVAAVASTCSSGGQHRLHRWPAHAAAVASTGCSGGQHM